jgi:hypothetical protein
MHFGWDRNARTARKTGRTIRTACGSGARAGLAGTLFLALSAQSSALAQQSASEGALDAMASNETGAARGSVGRPQGSSELWAPFTVDALFTRKPEAPLGFQTAVGSFLVRGSATGELTYNANLYAAPGAPRSGLYASATPEVRATSQWSRHSLEFFAGGEGRVYGAHDSDNQVNAFAGLNGIIDIYHDLRALAHARCALEHEERGYGSSFLPFISPIQRDRCELEALVEKQFNRVWLNIGGSARSDSYDGAYLSEDSGAALSDQSFRSGNSYEFIGRIGYELRDDLSIFVENSKNWHDYENTSFSSHGYRLLGGIRFGANAIMSAELAGGWLQEEFDSSARTNVGAYSYRAQLTWRPDELVSVAAVSERRLGEPSMFYGGSSTLITEAGLEAGYAWRPDVQLVSALGYAQLDYVDRDQTDELVRGRGSINYQINLNVNLSVNYIHEQYLGRPSELAMDYGRDSITVGLTAHY